MKKAAIAVLLSAALLLAAGCRGGETTGASSAADPGASASEQGASGGAPAPVREDVPVATLGEYAAYLVDYTYFYSFYKDNLEYQAASNGYTEANMSDFWNLEQGGEAIKDMLAREALNSSKEYAILYKMAVDGGVGPNEEWNRKSDEQVDFMLETEENNEERFQEKYLMTPAEMKGVYYKLNLVEEFRNGIKAGATVTEDEIKAAYEKNRDAYEQVTVRHVLIKADDAMTEAQREDAKKKADDILARIQNGEDIGKLAGELSEDPGSKDNNGEYTFPKGRMVAEFETWAFEAAPGDQGIVQTSYGYHIMEKIAHLGYDEAKEQVEDELRTGKMLEELDEVNGLISSPDWKLEQDRLDSIKVKA